MQHAQLLNLTTGFEMGSTCNFYGVKEQYILDFDVEIWGQEASSKT
jgi:hypothetical protein